MKIARDKRVVPVLMFHSVGLEAHPWVWSHLSEPVAMFERKIGLLKKRGFHSIFWDDLHAYMSGVATLPGNPIMLTFDDGYLDNWVYVYPILKKYGFKATIFVTPDFVDPSHAPRPTLEDVWAARCRPEELEAAGFLSWAEMREMEACGVIDIQSHALTHTWYFSGPRIVDFHSPAELSPYPWISWNARPERKPRYLTEDQSGFLGWGHPILQHEKSLVVRRYCPDEAAVESLTRHVAAHGGIKFFDKADWRGRLLAHAETEFGGTALPGRYESDEERVDRIRHELAESKRLLQEHLGKRVDYICWPGGGNDPKIQEVARAVGYKAWTLGSHDQTNKRNVPGADPTSIKRIGTANQIKYRGRLYGTAGPTYQLLCVMAHQRSVWLMLLARLYKAVVMTRNVVRL